ncbi:MAG: glycosyltransferase, partial [Patescibacteria group bacterium]
EIASFGKPSILVPLRTAANDHQKANAYEYADSGASIVIEENNFTINLLLVQIKNILEDKEKYRAISEAAKKFFRPDAAETIGQEIVKIALRK